MLDFLLQEFPLFRVVLLTLLELSVVHLHHLLLSVVFSLSEGVQLSPVELLLLLQAFNFLVERTLRPHGFLDLSFQVLDKLLSLAVLCSYEVDHQLGVVFFLLGDRNFHEFQTFLDESLALAVALGVVVVEGVSCGVDDRNLLFLLLVKLLLGILELGLNFPELLRIPFMLDLQLIHLIDLDFFAKLVGVLEVFHDLVVLALLFIELLSEVQVILFQLVIYGCEVLHFLLV